MNTTGKKRYLITYMDGNVSAAKATGILGVNKNRMMEGLAFMESESVLSKDDVLHFDALGISSVELSSNEATQIASSNDVMAVEEDLEMFALGKTQSDDEQFNELFLSGNPIIQHQDMSSSTEFQQGYNQALTDVFANLLKSRNLSMGANVESLLAPKPAGAASKQAVPWNIAMVNAPAAWARGIDGKGIKVAILDTGIASHPDLVVSGGACFIPGKTSYNDLQGHGTHCAGIVAARNNTVGTIGVAPQASLYAVKVLDDSGAGMTSWIIAGMEWCIKNKMKVASMSLGGSSAPMTAYANAIKRCQDNGVTVVMASGNSYGTNFPWVCSPANSVMTGELTASPIAVGAVDSSKLVAPFSSRGGQTSPWNYVNCVAPGVAINSTYLKKSYKVMSGTSMACPHVAGLAALIIQKYPGISPINVKKRIATTSTDLGSREFDITYGFGLINCDKATL